MIQHIFEIPLIALLAIYSSAYIYIRGEFYNEASNLQLAVKEVSISQKLDAVAAWQAKLKKSWIVFDEQYRKLWYFWSNKTFFSEFLIDYKLQVNSYKFISL